MLHDIVITLIGLFIGIFMLRLPRLEDSAPPAKVRISVIIPARNEQHHIAALINDLQTQTLTPWQIICVDDASDDDTADTAKTAGASVVSADERPEGWVGKTWACQTGAQTATGELLLFLDADVRLKPHALARLAALQQKNGGVVSVQPYHTVRRFFEHFSMYFNIIAANATGLGLRFLKKKNGLFGPVMLLPRSIYLSEGGHTKVKSKVLEDMRLGEHYAQQGIAVSLRTGRGSINYRMYPHSFGALYQGWTKNFFSGAVRVSVPLMLLVVVWVTAMSAVCFELARIAAGAAFVEALWLWAPLYALCALNTGFAAKAVGNFRWWSAAVFPVFLLGFHILFLTSVFKRLVLRRVTWKGRRIRL